MVVVLQPRPPPVGEFPAPEAIDDVLTENDCPKAHQKGMYPDPGFAGERSGAVARRGSYAVRLKLRAVAYTRAFYSDCIPVGNNGAGKVLGSDRKRIISWVREEDNMEGMLKTQTQAELGRAKS